MKISKTLRLILKQSEKITADWESKKKLHLGNHGYLNLAINYPEIMKEITIIKQLIKSFNKGRANIQKFRDLIINHNIRKPDFIPFKPPSALEKPPSMSETIERLSGKTSPYGKEEFKEISL